MAAVRHYVAGVTAVMLLFAAVAQSAAIDSTPQTPILVELFTSEGCSSCPPADSLLRKLDASQPVAGAQVIVLEEHVDYWDHEGWKDQFSSHEWTLRQLGYSVRLHIQDPYTPEMVVDGGSELLGSDARRAMDVIQAASSQQTVEVHISALELENGKIRVRIQTGTLPEREEVFLAVALDHAESQVLRGENGGRRLEHVAVLQSLSKVGRAHRNQPFSKEVVVGGLSGKAARVIAFVQEPNQGKVIGATMMRLQP